MMKDIGAELRRGGARRRSSRTPTSNWRPRVPQWPAIGDTMATAIQSALVGQKKSEGSARRGADAHRSDHEELMQPRTGSSLARCSSRTLVRIFPRRCTTAMPGSVRTLAQQERRFALALFRLRSSLLSLTTTTPLVYLAWTSLMRIDLSMPWLSGFAGHRQLREDGERPALLEFARC